MCRGTAAEMRRQEVILGGKSKTQIRPIMEAYNLITDHRLKPTRGTFQNVVLKKSL